MQKAFIGICLTASILISGKEFPRHEAIEPVIAPILDKRAMAKEYAQSKLNDEQYSCLLKLWNKESHWTWNESYYEAYGIPQAVPGSKMASAGADWKTNPITQVRWGLQYIERRYGSACAAWNFWTHNRWY